MVNVAKPPRLDGLDVVRFLAFAGMVLVNFRIVMEVEGTSNGVGFPEGRAAATFIVLAGVVLAGIGPGLAAQRAEARQALDMAIWFCQAHASWHKGTVENTNPRLRRSLPRKLDINKMADEDFRALYIGRTSRTSRALLSCVTLYHENAPASKPQGKLPVYKPSWPNSISMPKSPSIKPLQFTVEAIHCHCKEN